VIETCSRDMFEALAITRLSPQLTMFLGPFGILSNDTLNPFSAVSVKTGWYQKEQESDPSEPMVAYKCGGSLFVVIGWMDR
jgi:hypothetical protein